MTIDGQTYNTIDEYVNGTEGVDISYVNVGDYISNYPVEYTNIGDNIRDEFIGWRVLSKETDESGNTYVKLISAGVPLSYSNPLARSKCKCNKFNNRIFNNRDCQHSNRL